MSRPASAFALLCPCRRGEGAFRLQSRGPELRPQPLDKYELRETKRRLQQGVASGQQSLRSLPACPHLSPLRPDPFCGEHACCLALGSLSDLSRGRTAQVLLAGSHFVSLACTAACQPPSLLPASPHLDYLPLWLQWVPQPQPRVRPKKCRRRRRRRCHRPRIRQASLPPVLHTAYVSLHRWGGCGPHCRLQAEATVTLQLLPQTRWTAQQDWYWARRYGLPAVVRVGLTRLAPALPVAPAPAGNPDPVPTPALVPKQALTFAPFCPPKRLRLVVSHGSIDLDINSGEP